MNRPTEILDSEKTLQILKEIEKNPHLTQRDLARRLTISLGKINFLISALIDRGMVKAKNFKNSRNKIGYMYLLTPEGIKMKIRLVRQFLLFKVEEYKKLEEEIESLKREFSSLPSELEPGGDILLEVAKEDNLTEAK